MIRRRFLDLTRRAFSGAIFACALGVKSPWRYEDVVWRPMDWVPAWYVGPRPDADPTQFPALTFVAGGGRKPSRWDIADFAILTKRDVDSFYYPPRRIYVQAKAPEGWTR